MLLLLMMMIIIVMIIMMMTIINYDYDDSVLMETYEMNKNLRTW